MGMRMGMAWWEWGMRTPHFTTSSQRKRTSPSVVLHQLLWELQRTTTHSTVIAHQLRSAVSLRIYAAQKAAMNRQNMSTWTRMGAGGNGDNQWEWWGNGNKTRLNLGSEMRMGMNHREWEGMGLKKTFPLISNRQAYLSLVQMHVTAF